MVVQISNASVSDVLCLMIFIRIPSDMWGIHMTQAKLPCVSLDWVASCILRAICAIGLLALSVCVLSVAVDADGAMALPKGQIWHVYILRTSRVWYRGTSVAVSKLCG